MRPSAIRAAICLAVLGMMAIGTADAALPNAHPGPTVDDYTAAQTGRAEAAAKAAGFDRLEISMVQDANFFLKGEKAGQDYDLTVTPDGHVYPSTPLGANG
jgi:hypothetical protein